MLVHSVTMLIVGTELLDLDPDVFHPNPHSLCLFPEDKFQTRHREDPACGRVASFVEHVGRG